jgi:hypothetical protein
MKLVLVLLAGLGLAGAQIPTGTIAGVVHDPSGATVAAASIKAVSVATGLARTATISEQGGYSFPALLAGGYEVSVEAAGFQRVVRSVSVEAGTTTTANFVLNLGQVNESITVDAVSPQIRYDSHSVDGLITRDQIANLPLNGRSFLELAKLEPGGQPPPSRFSNNRTLVPVLGQPVGNNGRGTRVTVDGGSIMAVGNGGSAMGFSQEVVQEFQVSSVNLDLSTGLGNGAAVNVVTRSGGKDLHGTAFYFFRDHTLAAHPALGRDQADPDPFFQRRQFGFALGGPVRRDRLFFFGNWERNEQRGVLGTTLAAPEFAHFSRITASPTFGNQFSIRLDGRVSDSHTAFLRYSHDGSRGYSPGSLSMAGNAAYPSQWSRQSAWVDQSIIGLTSVLQPAVVNDLRLSYYFISSSERPPTDQDCPGCLGIEAPAINVPQANLYLGSSSISENLGRRFHLHDAVTWQSGRHRARFGVDWEHNRGGLVQWFGEPATVTLYSPRQARENNVPAPSAFRTLDDILQLPLQRVDVSVGDPRVPQEGGGMVRNWNTLRLYSHDVWRLQPRLTLNYGLGWNIDRNLNHDLAKPQWLAPVLGSDGLRPTRKQWKNFSPVMGLAWAITRDNKSVVRAGAGIFYDFLIPANLDGERALLGPANIGRRNFSGEFILNTLPGISGVPVGTPLNFLRPTSFTGANLISLLPALRADLLRSLNNSDLSVPAVQITKQVTTQLGGILIPSDFSNPSALHASIGIQREIARDFVITADFAYRHFIHFGLGPTGVDVNHFNSTRGPVIPACTTAQQNDPQALCSRGQISVAHAPGRATGKALALRADKRLSRGFQLLGSWAYSSITGTNVGNGFNLDNWLENHGPLPADITHIVNLAGVLQLPGVLQLGLNFSYSSVPTFTAFIGGIDFNGDGTTNDLLPGSTVNGFNRGLDRKDLERLVARFNERYANTRDSKNVSIPRVTLPERYSLGDHFHSLDLRLTRSVVLRERYNVSLIGEVFNVYNAANLSGFSGNLTTAAFGQATSRITQVFGSGGPRAFQLAMRLSF